MTKNVLLQLVKIQWYIYRSYCMQSLFYGMGTKPAQSAGSNVGILQFCKSQIHWVYASIYHIYVSTIQVISLSHYIYMSWLSCHVSWILEVWQLDNMACPLQKDFLCPNLTGPSAQFCHNVKYNISSKEI